MELQNPNHEELEAQLIEASEIVNSVELTPQPPIVDISANIATYWTPEARTAWRAKHRGGDSSIYWTPEVRDAWRAKHRGANMGGLALNSLTRNQIIKRS